jgi:hypothetical protein
MEWQPHRVIMWPPVIIISGYWNWPATTFGPKLKTPINQPTKSQQLLKNYIPLGVLLDLLLLVSRHGCRPLTTSSSPCSDSAASGWKLVVDRRGKIKVSAKSGVPPPPTTSAKKEDFSPAAAIIIITVVVQVMASSPPPLSL